MGNLLRTIWRVLSAPFRFIFWVFRSIARWISSIFHEIRGFFTEEIDDAPVGDAVSKAVENPQEILVHLDALRKHLFRAAMALVLTTAFSFIFNRQILCQDLFLKELVDSLSL